MHKTQMSSLECVMSCVTQFKSKAPKLSCVIWCVILINIGIHQIITSSHTHPFLFHLYVSTSISNINAWAQQLFALLQFAETGLSGRLGQ